MNEKVSEYLNKGIREYVNFISLIPNADWRKRNKDKWINKIKEEFDNLKDANRFTDNINSLIISRKKKRDTSVINRWKSSIYSNSSIRCVYCNIDLDKEDVVADHKVPLHKGGQDKEDNLQVTCEKCNSGKTDNLEDQFSCCWYNSKTFNELITGKKTITKSQRYDILECMI